MGLTLSYNSGAKTGVIPINIFGLTANAEAGLYSTGVSTTGNIGATLNLTYTFKIGHIDITFPCPPKPGNPPAPTPPTNRGPRGGPQINPPHDPNSIIGPAGFGDESFVSIDQVLPYQIDFENEPTAGLPAQQVVITQQLDSNLNWQSFRLGSFGFGGTTYTVPANTAFYQTQIDLTKTNGYYVDVTGTIDERTGIATWTFTTIDPATGEIPLDPSVGFLPPDNSNGIGEGFVSYTALANPSDVTGTVINAQATVDFYT